METKDKGPWLTMIEIDNAYYSPRIDETREAIEERRWEYLNDPDKNGANVVVIPLDQALVVSGLVKHLKWINDIVGTACDGGDAWCAVRTWPGASEWAEGMGKLLKSLGFPAKARRGRQR